MRGWWNMACWCGLSADQQEFLRTQGYLPFGYVPAGVCPNGAEVEVTTMWDEFPGPRFYCRQCAVEYLASLWRLNNEETSSERARTDRPSAPGSADGLRVEPGDQPTADRLGSVDG